MTVWNVEDVAVTDRYAFWHDVLCTAFVPLQPTVETDDRQFVGRVESRPMGPMVRSVLASQPQRTAHGPRQVSATDGEFYFLNLQLQGRCRVRQRGEDNVVDSSEVVLVDTTEPYWFEQDQDWSIMSFRLPKDLLDERCGRIAPRVGVPISPDGAGAVLGALMPALWQVDADSVSASDMTEAVTAAVAAHVCAAPVPTESSRLARRAQVLQHVRRHLADPGLSVDSTARDLHLSARTLHAVFDDTEDTFAGTVRAMRMRKAADLLSEPGRLRTVTDVAGAVGFADPSAFTRAFRRHFGTTPSQLRQQGRR